MAPSTGQAPPLPRLPRPNPRRTKPWRHYLLWAVHNTIERTIRIGVPAIVVGVPLLIVWHTRRPDPPAPPPPPPRAAVYSGKGRAGLAQQCLERGDYRGAQRQADKALQGLRDPQQRQTLLRVAILASLQLQDYAHADSYFEQSGRSKELGAECNAAVAKLIAQEVDLAEKALRRNGIAEAQLMVQQAIARSYRWRLDTALAARAADRIIAAQAAAESPVLTLRVLISGNGTADSLWTLGYASPAECRLAAERFVHSGNDVKDRQAWLVQERTRAKTSSQIYLTR